MLAGRWVLYDQPKTCIEATCSTQVVLAMKNTAIQRLKQLYLTEHYRGLPNIPQECRFTPKFSDKTANGLTKCIITWLRLSNWQTERISSTGRVIDRSKVVINCIGQTRRIGSAQWIKGSGTNGTADIAATIIGRSVKIEVKIGRDKQSDAQKEYQRQVEAAGGVYIIARTFDGFLEWYDQFIGGSGHGK